MKNMILVNPLIAVAGVIGATDENRMVREIVRPTRIVWTTPSVERAEKLLEATRGQTPEDGWNWVTMGAGFCTLTNDGENASSVLVDFGRELHGGLRFAVSANLRTICACESVSANRSVRR